MSRRKEDDRLVRRKIGENVERRRLELGISRVECARRAGLSVREIAALEAGERQPLASTLKKVSCALEWGSSELLVGVRWVMPGDRDQGHIERGSPRRSGRPGAGSP